MMKWTDTANPLPIPQTITPSHGTIEVRDYQVSEEDRKVFWKRGYWKGPVVLDAKACLDLSEEFERIYQGQIDGDGSPYEYPRWKDIMEQAKDKKNCALRKINNGWWVNESVASVVKSPVIGKIAADLLKVDSIRLWHDQIIYKPGQGAVESPGEDGNENAHHTTHPTSCALDQLGNVGWHQDYAFWQCSDTKDMITAFIVLQDTTDINGTLHTVVGSHRWGLQKDSASFFQVDNEKLSKRFAAEAEKIGEEWIDEECVLKAGQVVFHHALTFHGSGPNYKNTPRKALAIHMQPGGTKYRKNVGWHQNVKDLGPNPSDGTPFEGPTWPILYEK